MPGSNPRGRSGASAPGRHVARAEPGRTIQVIISGYTRDSAGSVLGNCVVDLFRTVDDLRLDTGTSDANGYYQFRTAVPAEMYFVVAYKAGAPDTAGTTVNTLIGS